MSFKGTASCFIATDFFASVLILDIYTDEFAKEDSFKGCYQYSLHEFSSRYYRHKFQSAKFDIIVSDLRYYVKDRIKNTFDLTTLI